MSYPGSSQIVVYNDKTTRLPLTQGHSAIFNHFPHPIDDCINYCELAILNVNHVDCSLVVLKYPSTDSLGNIHFSRTAAMRCGTGYRYTCILYA